MSSNPVISVENLGKAYHVYKRPEDRLKQLMFGGDRRYYDEFWAIRNVTLTVNRGETVGIVGRNGSGKSTFLQMVCGTLTPTEGSLRVKGRIAALLELGAGFNPDFTGRENVMFNAAVLGMSPKETEARFDKIAAFAALGAHIEQSVKTYSTGMFARLAFAVAIHVDPDILVIDEALSVGDEAFQKKCFSRLQELREAGVTILFVSHSAGTVIEICNKAVLFDQGEQLVLGPAKPVVALYQKLAYSGPTDYLQVREDILQNGIDAARPLASKPLDDSAPDNLAQLPATERYDATLMTNSSLPYPSRGAQISSCRIVNADNEPVNVLSPGVEYIYEYHVTFDTDAYRVSFGMMFKSLSGLELGGMGSHDVWRGIEHVSAGACYRVRFRFQNKFLPGVYFLNAGCNGWSDSEEIFLHRIVDAVAFRVEELATSQRVAGILNISFDTECEFIAVEQCETDESELTTAGASKNVVAEG